MKVRKILGASFVFSNLVGWRCSNKSLRSFCELLCLSAINGDLAVTTLGKSIGVLLAAVILGMSKPLDCSAGGIRDVGPFCLQIELSCEFAVVLYCQEIHEGADRRFLRMKCLTPVVLGQNRSRLLKLLKGTCSAPACVTPALHKSADISLREILIQVGIRFFFCSVTWVRSSCRLGSTSRWGSRLNPL